MPTTEHQRGETVVCEVDAYDWHSVPIDPDTVSATLIDSAGTTIVNGQAMTKDATGKYYYGHTLDAAAALGTWTAKYIFVSGIVGTTIIEDTFTVVP
jgi:hypothetical protein